MDSEKEKISAFQFYSLLYLSRVLTTVTYIPSYTKGITETDLIISTAFRFVFGVILMLPVYFLYRRNASENILDAARRRSPVLAKLLAVAYAFAFLYFTVSTIARLDVFAGTIIFPETNVNYLLLFVVITGCYGAYLGLQPLGRSAVLFLIMVVPALVFVASSLTKKVDILNFSPLFYNGAAPVMKTALNALGRTVEYITVVIALPRVTGNVKKGYFLWLIAQNFTAASLFFLTAGVMGGFTDTQLFPMHTLASIAQFSLFERLDSIFTGVWILCAFLKIAFLIYLMISVLKKEFGNKNPVYFLLPTGVFLTAANLYTAKSVDRFMTLDNSLVKLIITLTSSFALPLIILLLTKKKEKKKCEKQQLQS